MLELRSYAKPELSAMFGTRDMQGLKRKLTRYGIVFDVSGRGESAVFTIKEIADEFKIFCITELGFDGATDFRKLQYFFYCFFNDDEFRAMPDEVKEVRTEEDGNKISRQTIAHYISKLNALNMIDRNTSNFIYYFAFEHTQRIVEKSEYSQAWHEYWDSRMNGMSNPDAIRQMRMHYGGVARKQAIPEINGIYNEKIEYLLTLVYKNIEKEIGEEI